MLFDFDRIREYTVGIKYNDDLFFVTIFWKVEVDSTLFLHNSKNEQNFNNKIST